MREPAWWAERIRSGLASYWVYQHLGNLSPDEIADDPLYAKVVAAEDATDVLREFGERVDRGRRGARRRRWRAVQYHWSYRLDLGRTRLVMLDNRCSRVLEPGAAAMLRDRRVVLVPGPGRTASTTTWWSAPRCPGCCRRALHDVEAWNERAGRVARGRWVAGLAEKLRRARDLEHWAAFRALLRRPRRALRPDRQRRRARRRPGRRQAATRRRPRSACSPATCTTRTWPGPGSTTRGAHPGAPARPAHRSTTRCRPRCAR